ncbi:hypothetical protein MLD38_018649 [Melastoma candidum]|uniref:Uncharacterized protein n=1 Tax=Melastoma candidum TaxID=119954 RepID=A0ACB9R2Q7_9MYRT|nr:hypothetical protein MLD38_018649 [Melastoma candidum]
MSAFGRKGASGFSAGSTAEEVTQGIDGTGLTAIVTGATRGIGLETARVLALRGVHVIMAVRNVDAGGLVKEAILKEYVSAKVDVMALDLSSMASVRNFAAAYSTLGLPLNILINNAGILACRFALSPDNVELQFATNHLGHFLLTDLVLEKMKITARETGIEGRIVILTSEGHRRAYREGILFNNINDKSRYCSLRTYGQSKLANILHAGELSRRLEEEGANVTANSVHPGVIATNIIRQHRIINAIANSPVKYLLKSIPQGAATTCYVALHPQVKGVSGVYFMDSNIAKPTRQAQDVELAKKLWDFSISLTNPK